MTIETPFPLDPWIAASLMQKAIRRGEPELAAQGAVAYYRMRGNMIWRRLIIIAFEDIGVADPDVVACVTRLCVDRKARAAIGSDPEIIDRLARDMAMAAKDRSADYLLSAIKYHPDWEAHRALVAPLSARERIRMAVADNVPLPTRAVAIWFASGVNGGGPQLVGSGDLSAMLDAFMEAGLPAKLAQTVSAGAKRSKEPITVFLPLLWIATRESGHSVIADLPHGKDAPLWEGLPAWALDKHTAVGKRSITRFAQENDVVRSVLERNVADFRARDVALMAAFYADAITTDRRLQWGSGRALELAGMEADMMKVYCPRHAVGEIVDAVRSNLNHLHAIRLDSLAAAFRKNRADFQVSEGGR